jgi:pimeloyl-ACP methyl ester carboxylesterase
VARFFYLHEGTGTPVVLISPGDSPAYAWHNQLSVLAAAGHSVYVVDLPGQGRTVLHDSSFGWDLSAMTGALASFLDAVHLQRAALVGNSWSGGWALSFAQRYPHRVGRLALLDSSSLDVPDIWAWRVFKIPVLGELLANFDVTRGSVRSFLDLAVYHRGWSLPRWSTSSGLRPPTGSTAWLPCCWSAASTGARPRPGSARPPLRH